LWGMSDPVFIVHNKMPRHWQLVDRMEWPQMKDKISETASGWLPEVMMLFKAHQAAKDDALFDQTMARRLQGDLRSHRDEKSGGGLVQ